MKFLLFSLFLGGIQQIPGFFLFHLHSKIVKPHHCIPPIKKEYGISKYRKSGFRNETQDQQEAMDMIANIMKKFNDSLSPQAKTRTPLPIIIRRIPHKMGQGVKPEDDDDNDSEESYDMFGNRYQKPTTISRKKKRSENFEIVESTTISFQDVGGYENIKQEMSQCIDILANYSKYAPFNVRVPKGMILEGPPGNGKTLLAKAFSGQANTSFITVSGSEFQEKYVGVGASRIRELFQLARDNIPCVIFIDEIDALGRKRSSNGELSNSESDSTLNELLVALDGFKNTSGVFVIGATNRVDLLDPALIRPGRVDKLIFIGNPDETTRRAILAIHARGKPYDETVVLQDLVEQTNGFSGAQLENLLNEAMLHALRENRVRFSAEDIAVVMNKIIAGWQPNDHEFTEEIIHQIAIHELGHAVVSLFCKHHSKMTKIIINLSSPKTPAYTVFENAAAALMRREALFEHLVILLGGRIAEEIFFGVSVTTGAVHDFEEVNKLAYSMICQYGMGEKLIYPKNSEKYKEIIDTEISALIQKAYKLGYQIVESMKPLINEGATLLIEKKTIVREELLELFRKDCSIDV